MPPLRPHRSKGRLIVYTATVGLFRSLIAYRRALKTLSSIDLRLAEQNTYLKRLADHFAPALPTDLPEPSYSVDFIAPAELALVERFSEQVQHDQGRPPTEEEIVRYLADEATIDLRARMETSDV